MFICICKYVSSEDNTLLKIKRASYKKEISDFLAFYFINTT